MADRNALGMIGLLFGATTLFVMMMGAVVVADHLSGKLHLDDGLAVAQPLTERRAPILPWWLAASRRHISAKFTQLPRLPAVVIQQQSVEAPVKSSNLNLLSATALAVILAAPLTFGIAQAAEGAKNAIDTTAGGEKIPTTEQARAAKLMPDDPNPVPGQALVPATSDGKGDKPATSSGDGDPTTKTGGQAAVGGAMSPGASAGGANTSTPGGASGSSGTGGVSAETTGARPASAPADSRPGPIGATGQTMPSKFSQRNDILDRVPIMAMPMALTLPQRQRIYQSVMADTAQQPRADAQALAPATILSTEQALNETQALPESLNDIDLLKGLRYIKAKDKVLLVWPATRIVVDAITL